MIGSSIQAIIGIFLMLALGYFLAARGIATEKAQSMMGRLLIDFAVPCTVVSCFQNRVTIDRIGELSVLAAVAAITILGCVIAALLWSFVIRLPAGRRGVFTVMASLSNAGFIGLPTAYAVFGDQGLTSSLMYFVIGTIVGNSIILPWIQRDAAVTQGVRMGGSVFGTLKKIFTGPPILAVLLSLALLFLHIRLPKFIMVAVDGIADMTSGLSLIYTGTVVYEVGFRNFKPEKGIIWATLFRLVISTAFTLAVALGFGLKGVDLQVTVLMSALPSPIFPVTACRTLETNAAYSTKLLMYTLIGSFVTLPLSMAVVNLC